MLSRAAGCARSLRISAWNGFSSGARTHMQAGLLTKSFGKVLETSPLEFDFTGAHAGSSVTLCSTERVGQAQFPLWRRGVRSKVVGSRFQWIVWSSIGSLGERLKVCLGRAGVCALSALRWGTLTVPGCFRHHCGSRGRGCYD